MVKDQNEQAAAPQSLTVAEQIWNEIKDKHVLMFALPNQKVSDYCQPVPIEPTRCFLLHKTGALVPALEEVIGSNYTCEALDKYIVVSRKPKNAF